MDTGIESGRRTIVTGAVVVAAYALIATITGLQSISVAALNGRVADPGTVLFDRFLAVVPWLPATALILAQTRRAFGRHDPGVGVVWMALLGVAVVGAVNLAQAALLTSFGSVRGVGWLDQYATGLSEVGHFGYLWYVVVVLAAYAVATREAGRRPRPADRVDAPAYPSALEVGDSQSRVMLPVGEVEWIEARGDYVRVHAGGKGYLKLARMKVLDGVLDPSKFARVHRSAIVNLDRVREFLPVKRGDYELVLESGARVRLARSRREPVLARLRATSR